MQMALCFPPEKHFLFSDGETEAWVGEMICPSGCNTEVFLPFHPFLPLSPRKTAN